VRDSRAGLSALWYEATARPGSAGKAAPVAGRTNSRAVKTQTSFIAGGPRGGHGTPSRAHMPDPRGPAMALTWALRIRPGRGHHGPATMQVRRLLLLAPLALLGCQTGFEECKKYNWFVCAYNDATGGETEGETDSDPTTTQSTVSPAVCGDMVVEGDEVCDDGTMNTMDQWKVAKTCKAGCIEYADFCGDMAINGSEICDDPGGKNTPNPWEPTATCKDDCSDFSQYCGDGIINGPENCDSGVDNSDAYTGEAALQCSLRERCAILRRWRLPGARGHHGLPRRLHVHLRRRQSPGWRGV
jgi:hypothetical protein